MNELSSNEEMFDVVDEHDNVVAQLPRSEVHRRGLLHRAVSIFVLNSAGELLLQLRSQTKDEYPGCYTASASGHVSAGDSYDETAPRELSEELSLEVPVEYLAKFPAGPDTANEFTALYRAFADEVLSFDQEEVAAVEFASLPDVAQRIAASPDRFTPPFRTLFEWYCKHMPASGRTTNFADGQGE